jgi:hypothetical protein
MGTVPIFDPMDWGIIIVASLTDLFISPEVFIWKKDLEMEIILTKA